MLRRIKMKCLNCKEGSGIVIYDERMDNNMSDMIHKCIKCGEIAVPVDGFNFMCLSCDFEWEILGWER